MRVLGLLLLMRATAAPAATVLKNLPYDPDPKQRLDVHIPAALDATLQFTPQRPASSP